ncbi:MAG: hypothetical protein LBP87_10145 [Planctomycetaceae bacterium]|nr:hypothetical protein [Planctomycetaceae bacterium]
MFHRKGWSAYSPTVDPVVILDQLLRRRFVEKVDLRELLKTLFLKNRILKK